MGDEISHSADRTTYTIVNKNYNGIQHSGSTLDITIQGTASGGTVPTATAILKNMKNDGFTVPPVANSEYHTHITPDVTSGF